MLGKVNIPKKTMKPSGSTTFADMMSRVDNAELVRLLSVAMQKKIAGYMAPLGHPVSINRHESGVENR
ncbi:MAG: hypothetical protein ABSF60_15060 [Verrucomicrobiota bacterium]|jgi:hypothetical protein